MTIIRFQVFLPVGLIKAKTFTDVQTGKYVAINDVKHEGKYVIEALFKYLEE